MSTQTQTWDNNQGNKNNDPIKQPKDLDSIQKTDPRKNSDNPQAVAHQSLQEQDDKNKASGRDIGLIGEPLVSIAPTSGNQGQQKPKEYKLFDHANQRLGTNNAQHDYAYPFADMEIDQGFFIPVEPGMTTDKLLDQVHDQINSYREQTAECEKDKDGNDVWESVVIQVKKRNQDGTIQLESSGKPVVSANQTNRPKLVYASNFIARPVVKGDNMLDKDNGENVADSDGVLVVRVL